MSRLEDRGKWPHLLFAKMLLRRVEPRLMEYYKPPCGRLGRSQVFRQPFAEGRIAPVHVSIRVEDCPVAVAIIEGKVGHPWIPRPCACEEDGLRGFAAGELVRGLRGVRRRERSIQRLVPIEKICQCIREAQVVG